MYYWNSKEQFLENEILQLRDIKEVKIGTAFFSQEGLRILKLLCEKWNLSKRKVHIYLSDEFTVDQPHELLRELQKIAQVHIFFQRMFHAKIYYFREKSGASVLFGSSNFTAGGFEKNIEFNCIQKPDEEQMKELEHFFRFCDNHSVLVDEDIIQYYEKMQTDIEKLKNTQNKIRKKLRGYLNQDDAFGEDDYELTDYFLNYKDYETFFKKNERRNDADIQDWRKCVQHKLLEIHKIVYPQVKRLGEECHWSEQNITSLISPCVYNLGKVSWLGVRYGKTKKEIDALNFSLGSENRDEIRGFQKHGCMQYCVTPDGFEVNIFLAVRQDAIDRAYILENLDKKKSAITKEIKKLQGEGMIWVITDDSERKNHEFRIDDKKAEEFCDFLRRNEKDGRESFLRMYYEPDDEKMRTKESIAREVVRVMRKMNSLYNLMVWRPKI